MSLIPTQALSADPTDRDTLHLLVQSGAVLFAYWQLSTRKERMVQEHFDADWRTLQPTLRFYDVTEQHFNTHPINRVSELPLPQAESCFLCGFQSGQSYYADLGIVNDQGQFLPLLRSNTIQIPPIDTNHECSSHPAASNQLITYWPTAVSFQPMTPETYEHFSAYSVYSPKTAYSADTESGGDID